MGKGIAMAYELISLPESSRDPLKPGGLSGGLSGGLGRDIGRTIARGAESVLGLPGDISSSVLGLANTGIQKVTGEPGPLPSQILPTSQNIRSVTKKLTGESLEPQSEREEMYDEVVGDLASFLLPVKGKIPFKGAIIKALGGNAAAWLTKEVGGGEGLQAASKIGFNLIAGLPGGRNKLTKDMKSSYSAAEEASKGALQPAKGLSHELTKDFDKLNSGIKTPWKKELKDHISTIQKDISRKDGTIAVKKAWDYKKELNNLISNYKTDRDALPMLKKTVNDLNGVLSDYAKNNAAFGKEFYRAEDIYRGLNQASTTTKFLQKHVNAEKLLHNPLSKALLLGGTHHFFPMATLPATAAGLGIGFVAREASKTIDFFKNSKEARSYYKNVIQASLVGNAAVASKNLVKLDHEADKYNPTESGKYELISL